MGVCCSAYSSWLASKQTLDRLKNCSFDSVDVFEPPSGMCKILSVYDADTVRVALPMSDGTLSKFSVRLMGIDAPERKPPRKNSTHDFEKIAAMRARARLLQIAVDPGTPLEFTGCAKSMCTDSKHLVRLEAKMFDKYGRILGEIFTTDGMNVSSILKKEGWARPYDGNTRDPWSMVELIHIAQLGKV